jgi:pantothenate kinase
VEAGFFGAGVKGIACETGCHQVILAVDGEGREMAAEFTDLAKLASLCAGRAGGGSARIILAMAGPPGSGKSTLADRLAALLNERGPGSAEVLPMDGYHYDDLYLVPAGLRPRKGAPQTFDVGGLCHTLQRLRARDEAEVAVPVFDRKIEIARAGARLIPARVPVIVVEGNWLLLDQSPWDRLRSMFDITVRVDVPEPVLRDRLRARWTGFGLTEAEIVAKLEENDLPNGRLVRDGSVTPDFLLQNG